MIFDGKEAFIYYMAGHGWEDIRIREKPFPKSELESLIRAGLEVRYLRKPAEASLMSYIQEVIHAEKIPVIK